MTKLFISHSTKDTEFVRQLAQALTEMGMNVWIDFTDIPAGMNWSTAVQKALDECEAMLVVISPEAMDSTNVENEWQYYLDEGKSIIPVRWQPAKVHFQLRRIQYVDFHEREFGAALDLLRAELQRQGIAIGGSQGQMHTFDSDDATPPQIQGGAQALARVEDILPPPFEWCEIPAGKVTVEAGGYLKRATTFEVPGFAIAKYPVIDAQFSKFVNFAGGYEASEWWDYSDAAQVWHDENPKPQDTAFAGGDLPRTNLCWYEAVAYCRWLSAATKLHITLPTEQQWQRAAQGDDGRTYPWGNEFDPKKCNTALSRVGHTTPVTQYPQGASLTGCWT